MRIFGFEIILRRAVPKNTHEVRSLVWNRSPCEAINLGSLNEAELRNELAIVHTNLKRGLTLVMTQDGKESLLFHPRFK